MKWRKWLDNWEMTSLRISAPFLAMEWNPAESDREAAWDLYIELLTRVATQSLADEDGDEQTALDSVYALFSLTREIIKRHGRNCFEFTKLAVVVLNQVVRPFTSRWHRVSLQNGFGKSDTCRQFRTELAELQLILHKYSQMLADMAGVEDLAQLEERS